MTDEELKNRFEAAQKLTIQAPEAQPLTGDEKPFETQLLDTSGSALSQPPKQYDMNATTQEEPSPYEGAKEYLQRLIDTAGSRQAETVRDEKLARAQEAVLGIGDMGRAIANMVATTHYAPNGFQDSGLSDKARERAERAKAERDKHRDELLNYHMTMGKLGENERSWKFQREMAKANQEIARERLRQSEEREQRLRDEFEFKQQKETWRQDFEQQKFNQKEKLAKMNADLKRWSEKLKMSRSEVAHTLAGYKIDEYQYIDDQGRQHKVKVRAVYNPKTEQLEAEQNDEVVATANQGNSNSGTPSNSNTSTSQKSQNQGNRITVEY